MFENRYFFRMCVQGKFGYRFYILVAKNFCLKMSYPYKMIENRLDQSDYYEITTARKNYTQFSLNWFKPVKAVGEQVIVIPCAVIPDYWRLTVFKYCLMAKLTE